MADMGQALGWDEEIEIQENEFEPVPAGEYGYEVMAVTRAQFNGSEKMGPCPVAKVQVRLTDSPRTGAMLFENLYLNTKSLWKIAQFFKSVGKLAPDAPSGERFHMDWTGCIGLTGRCKVSQRTYNGKTYNDVAEWLKPAAPVASAPQAQAYVPTVNAVQAPSLVQQAVNQAFAQAPKAPAPGSGF